MLLIYITIYITELLREFIKYKTKNDIKNSSVYSSIVMSNSFALPGQSSFVLNSYYHKPINNQQNELFKNYLKQIREETYNRLLDIVYGNSDTQPQQQPSKWWLMFSKRKFMNINKAS